MGLEERKEWRRESETDGISLLLARGETHMKSAFVFLCFLLSSFSFVILILIINNFILILFIYFRNSPFAFLLRFRRHMKAVKVATVFFVLMLAIIAFASATEPEVDYIFALDAQSPKISFAFSPLFFFLVLR